MGVGIDQPGERRPATAVDDAIVGIQHALVLTGGRPDVGDPVRGDLEVDRTSDPIHDPVDETDTGDDRPHRLAQASETWATPSPSRRWTSESRSTS